MSSTLILFIYLLHLHFLWVLCYISFLYFSFIFSVNVSIFLILSSSISWYVSKLNPLNANRTKWSNILKQFFGKLPTNCLSVFDHFVGLTIIRLTSNPQCPWQCCLMDGCYLSFIVQFVKCMLNLCAVTIFKTSYCFSLSKFWKIYFVTSIATPQLL